MSKREKVLLIILGAVFVLSSGYIVYAYKDKIFKKKSSTVVTSNTNLNENANTNANTNSNKVVITPVIDAGVTWITPEKLANLDLFVQKDGTDCDFASMTYYKTANLSSGGSIILSRTSCGMGNNYFVFKKDSAGKYYYLVSHNDGSVLNNMPDSYLADYGTKTFIDSTTSFSAILPPSALFVDNGVQLKKSTGIATGIYGFFSEIQNATKVGETNYGPVYRVLGDSTDPIVNRDLYVELADTTMIYYSQSISFIADDDVPNVTIDGQKNSSKYIKSLVEACGYRNNVSILKNSADLSSRITATGTNSVGDTIYYLKNANDAIMNSAYSFYKTGREDTAISEADFFAKKPVFFWKDPFGDYITFLNDTYSPMAECGKPVIYLYPEKSTQVSIEVGAKITKSEPIYSKGWDVLANPSGKLVWNGKTFDSLYWEGQGSGIYPEIKSGFVVEKKNIKSTLADHLTKLGLNEKEKTDFMAFWLPKMPDTPYVRFTWFGTREMDNLAPLKVTPKPDTIIRIFLDYEGLDQKIDLKEQKLNSVPRNGFTLIEWGGLLRGNLK
jgi:hypothetical protein